MIERRMLFGTSLAIIAAPVLAQPAWPTRPVRIIVPFVPGGSVDVMGRAVAQ